MLCLRCYNENEFVFCSACTPKWGDVVDIPGQKIFVGDIAFWPALKAFFSGKRVIKWWCGSDVLVLLKFPPGRGKRSILLTRLKMLLLKPFIFAHWVNGDGLLKALNQVAFISKKKFQLRLWVGKDIIVEKQPHQGFNVCYYAPNESEYGRWVYGLDIIDELIYDSQSLTGSSSMVRLTWLRPMPIWTFIFAHHAGTVTRVWSEKLSLTTSPSSTPRTSILRRSAVLKGSALSMENIYNS
jgi:hypothetical protein